MNNFLKLLKVNFLILSIASAHLSFGKPLTVVGLGSSDISIESF